MVTVVIKMSEMGMEKVMLMIRLTKESVVRCDGAPERYGDWWVRQKRPKLTKLHLLYNF